MKKLYIGNLSYDTREDDLRAACEEFGPVMSCTILTDRDTGRSRGFGFVEIADDDQAVKTIEGLDGANLDGRPLRVNEARPRGEGGGGGGGGRGGRGGFGGGGGGGRGRY